MTALDLLARREHSEQELSRKLASRGIEVDVIAATISALLAEGLLNNSRFAEAFIHSRFQRGQGPRKIRAELRERGIDDGLIGEYLDDGDTQWRELIEQVRVKRFGPAQPASFRERSRQM
ncbi:MAG: regulatory protein RecX, partial [Pseudomonadota bacterium]|nr:regulatory protein RecX [Pseudomonadota bacterium]